MKEIFIALVGLIVLIPILIIAVISWAADVGIDIAKIRNIKKRKEGKDMNMNRATLNGFSNMDEAEKWFDSLLGDKVSGSVKEFRNACKELGQEITEREELAFQTGVQSGVTILSNLLLKEVLPRIPWEDSK